MSETQSANELADGLFDRYLLPKVALTVILIASFIGTALTVMLTSAQSFLIILTKWLHLVSIGVLTGGLVWKHLFVRPGDINDSDESFDYSRHMYSRFEKIRTMGCITLLITTVILLLSLYSSSSATLRIALFGLTLVLVGLLVGNMFRDKTPDQEFRSKTGLLALLSAFLIVSTTGYADVSLAGGDLADFGVRVLHLGAFSVWIGGAVWNISIAVPTGKRNPTIPMIRSAGSQLERFRSVVRIIIPTLFITGIYQSYDVLGASINNYVSSVIGIAIISKVGLIFLLVGIFLTCPMWRACSPIEGVCDLQELNENTDSEVVSSE